MTNNINKKKLFFDDKGFTLLEILVALALFSLVISITVGIFVTGSGSQRKTIELYAAQREASYIMEIVSRELRMATAICDNGEAECGAKEDQRNNSDHDIEFKNYDGNWIRYCRSLSDGTCDADGEYFSRDGRRISSLNVTIENLVFYVSEDFNLIQPLITIVLKVKSTGKYGTSVVLQDSVSLRIYNL